MTNLSYIHQDTSSCIQSELDLFLVPPTSTQVEKTACISYQPVSSLSDTNVVEFFVAGTGEEYIDLGKTKLYVKARIQKSNGSPLSADESRKIGPVNNWLHSIFSQLDVFLNDRLVSTSNNLYPYRAYLETLLNHGNDATESQLTCALFHKDTAGKMDTMDAKANIGWGKRTSMTAKSSSVDMIGTPFADIFNQNRYLVNNVNMKLRLIRHSPEFSLMGSGGTTEAPESYRIVIEQATLFIHKAKIATSSLLSHAAVMQSTSAKYPIRRVEMKSFSISKGDTVVSRDNIVLGQMPTRVVLGLVDSKALNGDLTANPFNFDNWKLNYLALHVDSDQIPSTALTPDYGNGNYIREYQTLFDALGLWKTDRGICISRNEYPEGFTLYAFDLTPTQASCCGAFNLLRQGNLKLEMRFKEPLKETVSVVLHLTYENMLEVDGARNVVYDYST